MKVSNMVIDIVPISDFNKGKANKIFNDVKKHGTKLVVKHNKIECALMSPEEYKEVMEMLEDYKIRNIVSERLARLKSGKSKTLSEIEAMERLGIKKGDLDKMEIDLDAELER